MHRNNNNEEGADAIIMGNKWFSFLRGTHTHILMYVQNLFIFIALKKGNQEEEKLARKTA